jgi:hypothetical protein
VLAGPAGAGSPGTFLPGDGRPWQSGSCLGFRGLAAAKEGSRFSPFRWEDGGAEFDTLGVASPEVIWALTHFPYASRVGSMRL